MNCKFALYCEEPPGCICERCLYHHSSRCPHGSCFDDLRAKINPYDKAHPDKPPRKSWSNWATDQAYWCRGGFFYQEYECESFVEYDRSKLVVRDCLDAVIGIFQDGYISCSIIDSVGCEECMKRLEEKQERKEAEEVYQNCGLPKGYEYKCCLNKSGECTLYTAEYKDIDRAVEEHNCGFIRVNDRYLLWKHGVPYKDLNCGHCRCFEGKAHGICTNENVEPHAKGITVNGEKKYVQSREYWSGASACKEFIKKEIEEVEKYTCKTCEYSEDWGESVVYIKCNETGKRKDVKKSDTCANYMPAQAAEYISIPAQDDESEEEELQEDKTEIDLDTLAEAERIKDETEGRILNVPRCCDCKHFGKPIKYDGVFVIYKCNELECERYRLSHVNGCKKYESAKQEQNYIYRGLV